MIEWQWIYWGAQLVFVVVMLWVIGEALYSYAETREDKSLGDGHFFIRAFVAIIALSLVKDAFWTTVVFGGRLLPDSVRDPVILATILAVIQLAKISAVIWLWMRIR